MPILEKYIDTTVKISSDRMISIFGYANTFAVYLGITISLAVGRFRNNTKTKKVFYGIYIFIATITLLLTQSKATFAIIAVILLILVIKGIKDKKISKKWIIAGAIAIILFAIYVFVAKEIGKPLEITQEEKNCVIRGVEKNTKYKYEFDIEAENEKSYNTFKIKIVEVTRYFSERTVASSEFGTIKGIEKLEFETSKDADHIEIRIENNYNQKLIIKSLKINGSPYILEYKYILDPLVRVFTDFNLKYSSAWQRGDYWKDSAKIISGRWILGSGGNTWRTLYGQVQEYLYYAKECHSYPLEIWMSFGLLGIISYIGILVISVKNGIRIRHESLSILIVALILVLHSFMDFDMSYLIMEMMFFMLVAIINQKDEFKKQYKATNIIEIIIMILMFIIAIENILGFVSSLIKDDEISSKIAPWIDKYQYSKIIKLEENKIDIQQEKIALRKYIKQEPYTNQNIIYEIFSKLNLNDEDIKYLINIWKEIPNQRPYKAQSTRKRAEIMLNVAKKCNNDELRKEIIEIIKNDYYTYSTIILDYIRNTETEFISKSEFEYYASNYKNALELQNK